MVSKRYTCFILQSYENIVTENDVSQDRARGVPTCGRSGNRIHVTTRFFSPVQTGPGAYSASYKRGTGFFSEGGGSKSGRGLALTTLHPLPSSTEVTQRI
jgi:hypothetical protein